MPEHRTDPLINPQKGYPLFDPARAVNAEGARIGLVTCRTCGAALVIDPGTDFDVIARHAEWHEGDVRYAE